MFADSHFLRCERLRAKREWWPAYVAAQLAAEVWDTVLTRQPDNPMHLHNLSAAHTSLAACSRKLGDLQVALVHRQQAFEFSLRLAELEPDAADTALDLIMDRINLACAFLDLRTPFDDSSAAALLQKAQEAVCELELAGGLVGRELRHGQAAYAIETNLRIVQRRMQKAATQAASQPTSAPQRSSAGTP